MIRFGIAAASLVLVCASLYAAPAPVEAAGSPTGIDVLTPAEDVPWTGDRMRGARERLKDIIPGKRG